MRIYEIHTTIDNNPCTVRCFEQELINKVSALLVLGFIIQTITLQEPE